jgi:hypothetical protein
MSEPTRDERVIFYSQKGKVSAVNGSVNANCVAYPKKTRAADDLLLDVAAELDRVQSENARLQGELASLRSQVIPWRDGGKRGAVLPDELSAYGVDVLLVIDDEIIKAWTCNEGCEIIFDEGPQCDGFREWCDVDYYVPLSELPQPQEPTDGN